MRLGVYADLRFWRDHDGRLSTNRSFMRFITGMGPLVDEVVIFGRLSPEPGREHYDLDAEGVRFVALPWYPRISAVLAMIRAFGRSAAIFRSELRHVDAVWLFGPHPTSIVLALVALTRGTPIFLGVRQDYPRYVANRLPSRHWSWAVVVAWALDRSFRLLARRAGTVAIGEDLARGYSGGRAPVLSTGFSLIREQEIVDLDEALAKRWDGGELRLLSVGRLDPEKNPLLLIEALGRLRSVDPRWRLTIAGDGALRSEIEAEVRRLGLGDAVELLGDVSNGPELWRLYRQSHLFLHVSFTEGLPQVLYEAHAAGIPVVATAVGGVPSALDQGETGLLIPPGDVDAAVAAVTRVAADAAFRRQLISRGLASAHRETLEAQLERTVSFFRTSFRSAQAEPLVNRSIVVEE